MPVLYFRDPATRAFKALLGIHGGLGIVVGGDGTVAINRVVVDQWYAARGVTEDRLDNLDQKFDSVLGNLIYAGTYNAATRRIDTLASIVTGVPGGTPGIAPDPPPNGIGPSPQPGTLDFTQIPAAPWNAKWFFIVSTEGVIPANDADGVREPQGSVATHYRVGDWIISNGGGVARDGTTIAPMFNEAANTWIHLSYSSRMLLATSVVMDPNIGGVVGQTVQQAITRLETVKAPANRQILAGAGLSGGGTLEADRTLDVGAGDGITVHQDSIAINRAVVDSWYSAPHTGHAHDHGSTFGASARTCSDWNAAVENGFWMAADAPNAPRGHGGWWYGMVIVHNTEWVTQLLFSFTGQNSTPLIQWQRSKMNGAWGSWRRTIMNYDVEPGMEGLIVTRISGVTKWMHGMKSDVNEWRVQCYDGAGNFTRSGLRVLTDGRVIMDYTLQSGTASITPVANQNATVRVNFDVGFTTTPQVQVTPVSGVTGTTLKGWAATGVDANGFTLNCHRTNNTDTTFMWTATAD